MRGPYIVFNCSIIQSFVVFELCCSSETADCLMAALIFSMLAIFLRLILIALQEYYCIWLGHESLGWLKVLVQLRICRFTVTTGLFTTFYAVYDFSLHACLFRMLVALKLRNP